MDLHPDFRDLLSELAASNADYLIVGGWAVGFHAEPRFTKDLDLWVGQDPQNLARVAAAFECFGVPSNLLSELRNLGPDEFLILGNAPVRVDILRTIPGVEFEACLPRAVRVEWGEVPVAILSREDLLVSKRAAGRPRDLRDVNAIERAVSAEQPPKR